MQRHHVYTPLLICLQSLQKQFSLLTGTSSLGIQTVGGLMKPPEATAAMTFYNTEDESNSREEDGLTQHTF